MALLRVHVIGALLASVVASAAVSSGELAGSPTIALKTHGDHDGDRGVSPGPPSPVVWIAKASALAAPRATDVENATAALALGSLSTQELDELHAGLELLASRLAAQANPFGDDLEDGPPGEAMAAVRRSLAPALTAAHHLSARTQTSADGTFAIALGASCAEAPPGASCFPLWEARSSTTITATSTRAESELRERASFFAWPIASAAIVRFSDPRRAAEVLDALRDRARSPGSRISLALDERALAGADSPRVAAVRSAARAVLAPVRRSNAPELDALRPLAATPAPGRRVPWLTLGDGEIAVVPKLGALADLASFAAELAQLLTTLGADRDAQWVRRPRSLR